MNDHRTVRELLALRPADWSAAEKAQVERHLAACPECAATARVYAHQDRLIGSLPAARLTPSQRAQLLARISQERKRLEMRIRLSIIAGATAFVATLVAMAIGVKALLPQSGPSVESPVAMTGEPTPAHSLLQTIPFTICRSSETWTRPDEAEQAAEVWDIPRRQGIPREMLWWTFQQSFYRYYGGNSELFDAWPEAGLWTASEEDITGLCERENQNLGSGREIELWVLLHRVLAAHRQGDVYTITVEPAPAGYQIIRVPAPLHDAQEPVTPAPRDTIPTVTVHFVDPQGREIDHLPKTPPWAAMPTTREAITVTGTVVDNAASAQVVTLEDADGSTWSIPWLEGTIVRRADGTSAHFRDIAPGMILQVTGFRATDASAPTIAAVRVILPLPQREARVLPIPEMWPTAGTPVEGTLEASAVDEWLFEGQTGRSLTVEAWLHPGDGSADTGSALTLTVYDPNGDELVRASGTAPVLPFIYLPDLPGAGTYRLRVESDAAVPLRYSLAAVWFAASPSDAAQPPRASLTDPAQGAAHPPFQWPTARHEVTGLAFRDPLAPGHLGLDLAADEGEPVSAIADGTVSFAGFSGGYGYLVIAEHASGWSSYYGHLAEIAVAQGQTVRQGDVLGRAGATGFATGPHLYFELRYQERPVDPRLYLPYSDATATQVGELTLEEYPLVAAAVDTPDHMEFGQYALPGMKSRRAAWRKPIIRCAAGNLNPDCPPLTINGRTFTTGPGPAIFDESGNWFSFTVLQDGIPVYTHTLSTDYAPSFNPVLQEWQGQWVLETAGQVIINGDSLNEQLGYDEIFNWTILHGKPFYFYEQDGCVYVSYDGQTLPGVSYDEIIHDRCCEPAIFNVTTCADMVAFYARRGDTWYYVEIGVYGEG